jgi:hypothetical protein
MLPSTSSLRTLVYTSRTDVMQRLETPFVVALVLAAAHPILGQDCTLEPDNRVENCGFDAAIAPWTDLFGTATHDPSEGFASSGAAALSGGVLSNGHEIHFRQCITPVAPEVIYRFGGALRGGTTLPDDCRLRASTRSATDCSGGGTFASSTMVPTSAAWVSFVEDELTTTSTTVAVELSVICIRDAGNFDVHFDDAYFGEVPLFFDGFESGNTSAWSSSAP